MRRAVRPNSRGGRGFAQSAFNHDRVDEAAEVPPPGTASSGTSGGYGDLGPVVNRPAGPRPGATGRWYSGSGTGDSSSSSPRSSSRGPSVSSFMQIVLPDRPNLELPTAKLYVSAFCEAFFLDCARASRHLACRLSKALRNAAGTPESAARQRSRRSRSRAHTCGCPTAPDKAFQRAGSPCRSVGIGRRHFRRRRAHRSCASCRSRLPAPPEGRIAPVASRTAWRRHRDTRRDCRVRRTRAGA